MSTIAQIHAMASQAAKDAAKNYIERHGEPFYCGFAWVEVAVERTNSKLAKEFIACGFTTAYRPRVLMLWNPSEHGTQSMDVKLHAAQAYANEFKNMGYQVYARSRAD